MSDNTAAEDRAVDAIMNHVREYASPAYTPPSEWVRETFRLGLAAYNEIMNRPESTSDTSTVAVPVADVDEGNSEVTQS